MLAEATIRALNKHAEFCQKAAAFSGRPRERMLAFGEADELFFRLYPHHYRALQHVRVASQLGRKVQPRRDRLRRCESRVMSLLTGVIRDAITAADLEMATPRSPEALAFSVWALTFGTRALMNTAVASSQLGIEDGFGTVCEVSNLLFDALDWRPLSGEWDYQETRSRIRTELFGREWTDASAA